MSFDPEKVSELLTILREDREAFLPIADVVYRVTMSQLNDEPLPADLESQYRHALTQAQTVVPELPAMLADDWRLAALQLTQVLVLHRT